MPRGQVRRLLLTGGRKLRPPAPLSPASLPVQAPWTSGHACCRMRCPAWCRGPLPTASDRSQDVLYCTALYCTLPYCAVLTVQQHLYCTGLCWTVLCKTLLYSTAPQTNKVTTRRVVTILQEAVRVWQHSTVQYSSSPIVSRVTMAHCWVAPCSGPHR